MSSTEFHTGKLYPVKLNGSLEETCRFIAKRFGYELEENWRSDFKEKFDEYAIHRKEVDEEYFIHGEKLYRVIDHKESEDDDYFMKLHREPNGVISFTGHFYNGGTCFSEMMEDALNELEPTFQEQIQTVVSEIISQTGESSPKTVMSAGLLIYKNRGFAEFERLFTGAAKENQHDVFKESAYAATLEFIQQKESNENDRS